ncbi:hypothetical protein V8E53_009964 [Lactarius tabidus]
MHSVSRVPTSRVCLEYHHVSLPFYSMQPAASQPIRLKAARTLEGVLNIVLRHITAVPSNLQAAVQRWVPDVLAQQIVLGSSPPCAAWSTIMGVRCMGLEL